MFRIVAVQALRRRGRSLAVVAAIVVAAVSFSLLTSAVATSQLQIHGTVQQNYRSAYDILVRPAGSRTKLEASQRLVQQNYLSGIYGGITMSQYRQIRQIPGVQVAAPIAMIGYLMPFENVSFPATPYLSGKKDELLRVKVSEYGDNGLSRYPSPTEYVNVSNVKNAPSVFGPDSVCGMKFYQSLPSQTSAFDLAAATSLGCYTTNPPTPHQGLIKIVVAYSFPVLLAAIDPVQEAKLVGLDHAMVNGRYLTSSDKTRTLRDAATNTTWHQVPVLVANRPLTDASMTLQVQQLHVPHPLQIGNKLTGPKPGRWLSSLNGTTVHTIHLNNTNQYNRMLQAYRRTSGPVHDQFWSVGQVTYKRNPDGHLAPVPQVNRNPALWINPQVGFSAPQSNSDVGFRKLQVHYESNHVTGEVFNSPSIRSIGTFDPSKIRGFSQLSKVPLTTYYPPEAAPGNPRTARLLHGKSLSPDNNIAGYLQQPPMMLTTIKSLHSFTDPVAFGDVTQFAKAPISVIRVRVAGVTGVDALSRARVRLAAERIARETGLNVDITMGSSPHQQLIDLPAGNFGRPPLVLSEGWVKKGIAVALLSAIDTKSLTLFGLVLLVCVLFLVNATMAAVRSRRTELGILSTFGWPTRRIFALLESELLLTGLIAGVLGTLVAVVIVTSLHFHLLWLQLSMITPVSMLLAGLAGLGPVWRASRPTPMQAVTPAVRSPRKASRVESIPRLALAGLRRWPGRTILGAASLFVGVAALTMLIAIQQAFQGGVVGTSLGNVVAVQVRGVDYLAAALTVGLGAFAIADITYLNINERKSEIAVLRATGWASAHVRRLFGLEAVLTASSGAVLGAALAVVATAAIFPISFDTALTAAAAAATVGIASAFVAVLVPLSQLTYIAPAHAVRED